MTMPYPFSTQHVRSQESPASSINVYMYTPKQQPWVGLTYLCIFVGILLSFSACIGSAPAQQPDPRLKNFHILSSRITMMDNQAEVDGTVQNTGHDRFPFDVTIDATFYDSAGKVIGHAQGVAEDVYSGTAGSFTLQGQVESGSYSHMSLAPVSLRERRVEPNLPTPVPVVP